MIYRKSLAVSLILMLVLSMGILHQSYASHIIQHTHHHTPSTHSTGACFLMCAAAHTMAGDAHVLSQNFQLIALMEGRGPEFPSRISSSFLPTRAPPR